MHIEPKEILDKHITTNYGYYKNICWKYFKGNYLFEDLLHIVYLDIIENNLEQVVKYNDNGKLRVLIIYKIRRLFEKRKIKCSNNRPSSPLFESKDVEDYIIQNIAYEEIEPFEIDEYKIEKIKDFVFNQIAKDDRDTEIFVQNQFGESINSISKRTGINRPSLKMSCDRVKIKLKRL